MEMNRVTSEITPQPGASAREERVRRRLRELFAGRYERLEQIEVELRREALPLDEGWKLKLLRRAKFSTWLDLEALDPPDRKAA